MNFRLLPSCLKQNFGRLRGVKRDDVYEFKKDDIRIYVIKKYPSIFVILGAYKGTQDKNINRINKLFGGF